MNLARQVSIRAVALLAGCLMAACGGGGGGGATTATPDGPVTTPTTEGMTVTSSASSLSFVGFGQFGDLSQSVHFTLGNVTKDASYYGGLVDSEGLVYADYKIYNNSADVILTMKRVVGLRSGKLKFMLCKDVRCGTEIWSQTMPYTVTVFDVPTRTVSMQANEGRESAPTLIPVTPDDTQLLLNASTQASWLSVKHDAASNVRLIASGKGLAPGTYQTVVQLAFQGRSAEVSISVSFTVGSAAAVPPPAAMNLTASATQATLRGSSPVTFVGGAPAWNATSDQPWLVLTSASGVGNGAVNYTVDPSKLDGVENWSSATAKIVLHTDQLVDRSVAVTVNKALPEAYSVASAQLPAGTAASITVTGRGFSQLAGVGAFSIGGVTASSGAILSDTRAVLQVPALPVGRYEIGVANAAGLTSNKGSVSAVAATRYSDASLAAVGYKRAPTFDATRNALFVANETNQSLLRMRLVGEKWVTDSLPIPSIKSIAFSPDRKSLYVVSTASVSQISTLIAVDPDTLTIQARYPSPATLSPNEGGELTVTANGRIWFTSGKLVYFDMIQKRFGSLSPSKLFYMSYAGSQFVAPENGSYFYLTGVSSPFNLLKYTVDSDDLAVSELSVKGLAGDYFNDYLVSPDGATMLVGKRKIVDVKSNVVLGEIPAPSAGSFDHRYVFAPDGRRLYRMIVDSSYYVTQRIEVLDVATLSVIGTVSISDQTSPCAPLSDYDGCLVHGLIISPFGNVLFLLGEQKVVVLPVPATLGKQGGVVTLKNAIR